MCVSISFSLCSFPSLALDQQLSEEEQRVQETEIQNTIAEQIAPQTEFSVEELQNAVLIDLQPGAQNALDRSGNEKALRVLQTDGELVTATTLIPYSEENGKLVNSFALAAETWPIYGGTSDFNVGGIVLSIQVQYHMKKNISAGKTFKRHVGAKIKWNSSNSNVVTNFYLEFESKGREYAYPDCMNTSNPQPIRNDIVTIYRTTINQANPAKNIFYSRSNMGSLDRMFYWHGNNPMDPDGNVYWKFDVRIGGSTQTQDGSYYPYAGVF